ncbi:MAG: DHA2 family efflux MFS transporter permease subunit [Chitinophagaceae bacterium]|nr:DHA2 family efflux MFS transporter permease subunit [Chitinophagaceae bacterium]
MEPASLPTTYAQGARKWLITITVITCAIMELIDTSIVNVAVRQIAGNLGATIEETAWVITSYAISNIIIIPLTGFLSNFFGRRVYFTASVILFTIASLLCGASTSIGMLVFWRFVQGIGGGALLATAQTVLVETFPPEEINKANGIFGAGIVMGPTLGPVLGGYLTDNFSWEWIFYVNVPIGIVATWLSWRYIGGQRQRTGSRVDYWGIVWLVVGIGALQLVLEEGERKDWFESPMIVATSILAVLGLLAFVVRELRTPEPVVDIRLLARRNVWVGALLNIAFGIAIYCSVFLYPVFVQGFLGWNATRTGLLILPSSFLTGMLMGLNATLIQKGVSPKWLVVLGFSAVIGYEVITYFLATPTSGEWDWFWPQMIRGFGFGFIFVPVAGLMLSGLRGNELAQASGLSNMLRLLGGAVGIAGINTFVNRREAVHRHELLQNVSAYDAEANERYYGLVQAFEAKGYGAHQASQMATQAIDGTVSLQSAIISYAEGFFLIGLICAVLLPLVALARISKEPMADMGAVH